MINNAKPVRAWAIRRNYGGIICDTAWSKRKALQLLNPEWGQELIRVEILSPKVKDKKK